MKKQTKIIIGLIIMIVIVLPLVYWGTTVGKPGKYDTFAQCLEERGAIFYGAFWCPSCMNQKRVFGRSADLVPYVECSTADRQNQTQICIDAEITSYPTWVFADGERVVGETPLTTLSEKTGCELPA